jgi:hypothetical protein
MLYAIRRPSGDHDGVRYVKYITKRDVSFLMRPPSAAMIHNARPPGPVALEDDALAVGRDHRIEVLRRIANCVGDRLPPRRQSPGSARACPSKSKTIEWPSGAISNARRVASVVSNEIVSVRSRGTLFSTTAPGRGPGDAHAMKHNANVE